MPAQRLLASRDLSQLRTLLIAEADRLALVIATAREEEIDVREDVAGHDEMDDAITRLGTERSHSEAQEAAARLEQVAAARHRIDAGRYGRCADCDGPIGRERLLALPTADRCIDCQRAHRH